MEINHRRIWRALEAKHRRREAEFFRNLTIKMSPIEEVPFTKQEKACANNAMIFAFCILGAMILFFCAFFHVLPGQDYRYNAPALRQDGSQRTF